MTLRLATILGASASYLSLLPYVSLRIREHALNKRCFFFVCLHVEWQAPSPRASLIRPRLTISREALRATLLSEDPDGTPPSTTRSCVEFSRGGDEGAKHGEIEPFSPSAARRDRVLASASVDAAPQRKEGGQDRLVLPPLDAGRHSPGPPLLAATQVLIEMCL